MTARAPKTQKSCDFLSADPGNCHRIRFRGNRRSTRRDGQTTGPRRFLSQGG
jgi:hypothetical protein